MSLVMGNPCYRQFCSNCCKIARCYLYLVAEERQDAEYKNRQGA
jgi:hypothetical protein